MKLSKSHQFSTPCRAEPNGYKRRATAVLSSRAELNSALPSLMVTNGVLLLCLNRNDTFIWVRHGSSTTFGTGLRRHEPRKTRKVNMLYIKQKLYHLAENLRKDVLLGFIPCSDNQSLLSRPGSANFIFKNFDATWKPNILKGLQVIHARRCELLPHPREAVIFG